MVYKIIKRRTFSASNSSPSSSSLSSTQAANVPIKDSVEQRRSTSNRRKKIISKRINDFRSKTLSWSVSSSTTFTKPEETIIDRAVINQSTTAEELFEALPQSLLSDTEIMILNHHFTTMMEQDEDEVETQHESIECLIHNSSDEHSEILYYLQEEDCMLYRKCQIYHLNSPMNDMGVEEEESPSLAESSLSGSSSPRLSQCRCHFSVTPPYPPCQWQQRPLLLRAAPQSNMSIVGIRHASSSSYLSHFSDDATCPSCALLPINNGNEPDGHALVTDFTTPYFKGTLLLRIRHAPSFHDQQPYDDSYGYFSCLNRQYQAVIRGHFIQNVEMSKCYTGHYFTRNLSNLPSKIIRTPTLKILRYFAPRLKAQFDTPNPQFISPLLSTPQCIIAKDYDSDYSDLELVFSEPTDETSILHEITNVDKITGVSQRKKIADAFNSTQAFSQEKEYTFEFLQHLISYPTFCIDLNTAGTKIRLAKMLNGQPLNIMAGFLNENGQHCPLWSFELWNEAIYDDAKRYEKDSMKS